MNYTVFGIIIGAILAFSALLFDFWGFLLMAVFMLVGALLGRAADGKLDWRSLRDGLSGRRSSS
ncbi:DUF2273 domain-containing protein [Arthrobacter roseus]|uniref:DUF2273 domain-containing protein n=1 Tax=Arthrobacter roseus TaxID=136274 RepID=UPI001962EFB3|nr:putative membrane protein [Arthrobacter roseus]